MLKAILSTILMFRLYHEDVPSDEKREQLAAVANTVASVSQTVDEAAFLLAWGKAETHFSLRIHRGECHHWECDGGKARGPWQAHRNAMADERWTKMIGVENIETQAEQAIQDARWALRACPHDRIRGAFRVLAGRGCSSSIKGEGERVAEFEWIRRRLTAKLTKIPAQLPSMRACEAQHSEEYEPGVRSARAAFAGHTAAATRAL